MEGGIIRGGNTDDDGPETDHEWVGSKGGGGDVEVEGMGDGGVLMMGLASTGPVDAVTTGRGRGGKGITVGWGGGGEGAVDVDGIGSS